MAQEISLPIKVHIENLQSVLKDMRGQLSTLKVDSASYKKLSTMVADIEKRIQQLQVSASRPFIDAKQFTDVEKNITRIEDDIIKMQLEAKQIKFGDLSLSSTQRTELEAFNQQIKEIGDALKNVKNTAKDTFLSTDMGKMWKDAHPEAATQTFAQVTNAISKEVSEQKRKLDEAKAQITDYQNTIKASSNLNKFIRSHHELSEATMGEKMYNQIFKKDDSFKANGKNLLTQWLKTQFHLDPAVIQSLVNGTGKQVKAAFAEVKGSVDSALKAERVRVNGTAKEAQESTNKGATLTAAETEKNAAYQAALQVQEALMRSNALVGKSESELRGRLDETRSALEQWKQAQASAAQNNETLSNSFKSAQGSLAQLHAAVQEGQSKLASLDAATGKLQGISNFVSRYVGAYAIIRKVTQAIRNAFNNIKELDKAITSIAVVTNMSQQDLWGKIGEYTSMAQSYGVATKDVYEVSQIFYQQGLQTAQVMSMTTESLKMAKIAGIDYSTAANAMTVAVRAFKLEMSEAQSVTDTYSALAAKFAVSSSEIANAMEKTASSAASVGMSLQSTSAFISVMEQTTRESAQNIGSALKSIISRYGEMKASPAKLLNVDGEEVAFNKVDTALASIGISIKDASGQFRDFDDVIMELASKWNTLDNNTQRYIATIMAGNRQQSRFIALVSNYDELSRAMNVANNAENASIVQVAKTMDSLESKANQVKNAFSQLYLDLHIEEGLKGAYDWLTRVLKTVGKLGTAFGALPTLANIIGFGAGAKSTISNIQQMINAKKLGITADVSQAEKEIDRIKTKVETPTQMQVKVNVDDGQLQNLMTTAQTLATQGLRAGTNVNDATFSAALADKQALLTQSGRDTVLAQLGINKTIDQNGEQVENPNYEQMNQFLVQLGNASEALQHLQQSAEGAAESDDRKVTSGDAAASTDDKKTTSGQAVVQTNQQQAVSGEAAAQADQQEATASNIAAQADQAEANSSSNSAVQIAQANYDAALAARDDAQAKVDSARATHVHGSAAIQAAREVLFKAEKDRVAAQAALDKAKADEEGAQSEREDANANREDAQTERENANANRDNSNAKKAGSGWAGHETGMRVAGLLSGAARMIGTAITAAGAAHQDKSTDKVETSKLLTGVGNGLSMAGTGASMGMAFGPWGAAIGAIGGFLVGGLGAIIDGATMTLEEQLALEKEEAKAAADESLKAQAKTIDLENSIDNIRKLREAMYNSTEDMEAYKDAMSTMANQYPSLISNYDEAGNAIIDLNAAENLLAETRLQASQAANEAAKAEAKTRQTTIDILNAAQEDVTNNYQQKKGGLVPNVVRSFMDKSGQAHAFEMTEQQWSEILSVANNEQKDIDNMSFNDFINFMRSSSTSSLLFKSARDSIFNEQNAIINDNGSVEFAKEYDYSHNVGDLNNKLKSVSDKLNITPNSDLPGGAEYIYAFMGWEKDIELTAARMQEVEEALISRTSNYKGIVENLDKTLPVADAQESLDRMLLDVDAMKATKISTSKIASKLIANQLEAAAQERNMDAGTWSRSENEELVNAYEETKTEATQIVVKWFTGLSDKSLDATLNAFNSMTDYLSLDQMLQALGYTDEADFKARSGLSEAESSTLLESWQTSFLEANIANRDRIIKTIYGQNENGSRTWDLNTDFKEGLGQLDGGQQALNIAYKFLEFDGATQIISKYADYFTTQLLDINELAEEGYTQLASTRLAKLDELASLLASNPDIQQDLFGIITNIDFSNFESIQNASDQIAEYGKTNGVDVSAFTTVLTEAMGSLVFNVNTLAQDVTTKITTAAKKIDSIASANKSGLSFDKALEEYENLAATLGNDTKFNTLFTYDASLDKYVYTEAGLQAAIEQNQSDLQKSVDQLNTTNTNYINFLNAIPDFSNAKNTKVENADKLKAILSHYNVPKELGQYQEQLVTSFFADTTIEHTLGSFQDYINQQIEAGKIEAEKAQQLLENYSNNLSNQYFQAIDWSKLTLGTDFSGTNQMLANQLAEEVGLLERIRDAEGNIISETWKTESKEQATPEELQDAYLEQLYAGQENAEQLIAMAKARLAKDTSNSKANMASTAISELLSGGVKTLSEESIALLTSYGQHIFKVDEQDNITSELDTSLDSIQLALDTYWKTTFNSIDEANNQYIQIIQASFAKANAGKSLLSNGNKLDLNTMGTALKSVGLKLDDVYKQNEETGQYEWKGGFENALTTDIFGETRITDWDNFVEALAQNDIDIAQMSQEEVAKWRRAYIDGVIADQDANNLQKSAATQLSNLASAKVGDTINISDVDSSIKSKLGLTGNTYTIVSEAARDSIIAQIDSALIDAQDDPTLKATLTQLKDDLSQKRNKSTGYGNIMSNKVSKAAAKEYMLARELDPENTHLIMTENLHFIWDEFAQEYVATEESIKALRERLELAAKDGASDEYINEQTAKINNLEHELQRGKKDNALLDILQNYTNVTEESFATFNTAFGKSLQEQGIDINTILKKDATTGTYDVDMSALTNFLTLIGFEMNEAAKEQMASIADAYTSNIQQATSLVSAGTSSVSDMDTFTKTFNEMFASEGTKTADQLFDYNEVLESWTLKPEILQKYVKGQADKLVAEGKLNEAEVNKWIASQTTKILANNVSISDFLSAEDKSITGDAYKHLAEQMREYWRSVGATSQEAASYISNSIFNLTRGGTQAVKEVQEWASKQGRTATSDEIEEAFNSAINELNDAMDQLTDLTVGQITTGKLREYLAKVGKVDENGVVIAVDNMTSVYEDIYTAMKTTAGKTTAGLNAAYAKVMTAQDQNNMDILDALQNASGMTYDALGSLLAKYNVDLETFMGQANNGVKRTKFGEVRILDFDAFMKAAGLGEADMNDPEMMKAYSDWVDARIEWENAEKQKVEDAVEEIKSLGEAKGGDKLNVSHLESILGDSLSTIAQKYGATLKDGLLTLSTTTNIPALMQEIANEAQKTGKMIPEQLAELADAVQDLLSQITSLIQGGIEGSLNNTDAAQLQQWATQNGVGQLDFKRTADGLKLSEQSAIKLYNAIKNIDAIQGRIVFDDLRESLEASRDEFKDTQSLLDHVNKIRNGTYAADSKISSARLEQYEAELEVAEEILAVRATSEDDSFNFMDNKIPAGQNNPLNYMQNWAEAYEKMKETKKGGKDQKGLMVYEDFYNIITEMGHLADLTGQLQIDGDTVLHNSQEAADLITKAAGALKVTSDGKMKVDLSQIGVDFQVGADKMSKDVDAGIDAVATAQIDMLDSMISLLEVVVAMEQLGDLDINGDNHIDVGEIFELEGEEVIYDAEKNTYKVKDSFKNICANIVEMANANKGDNDLNKALNAVKINGTTMKKIFEQGAQGFLDASISVEQYQQTFDAFYQMAISDDYDLDNLAESIQKIFKGSQFENLSIDVGTKTFYLNGDFKYQIDWSNKDAINAAIDAIKEQMPDIVEGLDLKTDEGVRAAIDALIKERSNNMDLTIEEQGEIDYLLGLASGDIKINDKKDTSGDHKGKYTGTYKGITFFGAKKEEVEEKIRQAILYEENGFAFTVEEDGTVTGKLNVGRARIEVKKDSDGNDLYVATTPNGDSQEFTGDGAKDQALGWLASQGFGDQGTYTYKDDNGKAVQYDVFVDSKTGLTYSISSVTGKFTCDGHDFNTFEALQEYLAFRETGKGGKQEYNKKTGIETIVKGPAKITYNHNTGEIKYIWSPPGGGEVEFKSKEAYEDYIAAWEKSGGNISKDGTVTYNVTGAVVSVNYNPDTGELTYTAHLANGKEVIAHDEDSLMFGIAAETKLEGGEVTADEKKTYSYVVKAGNVSCAVSVDENGTVTTTGDGASSLATQIENQTKENAENKLKADTLALEAPVKATVNDVDVDASAATTTITLPDKIVEEDTVKVEATSVTASMGTNATPDISSIVESITTALSAEAITAMLSSVTVSLGENALSGIETIAQQIAQQIQEALNAITITPSLGAPGPSNDDDGAGDGTGGGGGGNNAGASIFATIAGEIAKIDATPFTDIVTALGKITTKEIDALKTAEESIEDKHVKAIKTAEDSVSNTHVEAIKTAEEKINSSHVTAIKTAEESISSSHVTAIKTAEESIKTTAVDAVATKLNNLTATVTSTPASGTVDVTVKVSKAKGNMGSFAKGTKTALAGGTSTLMGELGPELVVSQGKYFVVGQSGAEFVDLDKDAIVFNHKQTERLMSQGGIGSRGVPFTNENNAISYAKGNVTTGPARADGDDSFDWSISGYRWHGTDSTTKRFTVANISVGEGEAKARGMMGPAMASAAAALAALKQLRAMWESLRGASAQDLAGLGGSHGGGGGGSSKEDKAKQAAFIKQLELWYNWLQKIATAEEKINHQEALRNKITSDNNKNGKAYYNSLRQTLQQLDLELATTKDLYDSQKAYFEQRRKELNSSKNPFSSLYQFDANGQLLYKDGKLAELSAMSGTNQYGKPNKSAKEQYEYIIKTLKIDKKYLQYDSSGNKIFTSDKKDKKGNYTDEAYQAAVQAFWDKIEADKEEMQSLHDSINQYSDKILELQQQENEILREMQDNQIEVENAVLDALVETRQRAIDKISDLRDAYQNATSKMINGLSNALNKERDKYAKNEEDAELLRLRRRLALLQRSGGSSSEIADLQSQIKSRSQDAYFNEQQRQIDVMQEASDKQIERMDEQINIMTETLEYQKKHGLLWNQVYDIMAKSPASIANYIQKNTEEYWGKSPLASAQAADDWLFKSTLWTQYNADLQNKTDSIAQLLQKLENKQLESQALKEDFSSNMEASYGDKWKQLSDKDKKAAQDAFMANYEKYGDYQMATAAGQASMNKTIKAQETYKQKYGQSYNSLSQEQKDKLNEAYRSGKEEKIAAAEQEAEQNGAYNETERKKKQFKAVKQKDGTYKLQEVGTDAKDAVDYDTAYNTVQKENAWLSYSNNLAKKYGSSWTNLSSTRKKTIEQQYKAAYDKNNGNVTDKEALAGQTNYLGDSTSQTQKAWIYQANDKGFYEPVKAPSNYKKTKYTYADALKYANRENDWISFTKEQVKLVPWNTLTDKKKTSLRKVFNANYKTADPAKNASEAVKKEKAYTDLATAGKTKQWAITHKDDKSKWTMKQLTSKEIKARKKAKKDIATYQQAYNAMTSNNALWKAWKATKFDKKKKPKWDTKYKYDIGGMVESTGPALLHAKEAVLTSQQTDVLRNEILGKNKNSLLNLLLDFKNAYSNIGTTNVAAEPSIIIQNASVNMNVASIANDYDARRAGEQALSEMMRIARKKGAASTLRR